MKISIGVFFGGKSVEHEISVISAMQAIAAIDKDKYSVVPVYITKDSRMYTGYGFGDIKNYKNIPELLKNGTQVTVARTENGVVLTPCRRKLFSKTEDIAIDAAFPVVHGANIEDGTIQGLFESLSLPYTGCDILSSAVCMDKAVTKHLLRAASLPVLPDMTLDAHEYDGNSEQAITKIEAAFTYPIIVKPVNLGSSVGISRASDTSSLRFALDTAFSYASRVLIERAVSPLREINCSVLGNRTDARASACEEPAGQDEILSYQDKYQSGGKKSGMSSLKRRLPAEIPDSLTINIQKTAIDAFKVLGCSGVVRIDFLLEGDDFYINEPNPIPGSLSFYLWEASGLSFTELTNELISLAFARKRTREGLTSSFETNILSTQNQNSIKK